MVKIYYKNEYTAKQWKALIDEAERIGCKVTYDRYGERAEIDSTCRENALINGDENKRSIWAEAIHDLLQRATDLRKWEVRPARRHKGYTGVIINSQARAKHEKAYLERTTGFKWIITVIPE